jgi:hypothetical protein
LLLDLFSILFLVTDSPTTATKQSSPPPPLPPLPPKLSSQEPQLKLIKEAKEFLNTVVQLGNRQEIEQLQHKIKVKTNDFKSDFYFFI